MLMTKCLHLQVLQRLTIDRFENIDPKPTLTLVPQNSLAEFWLPLTAFCVGQDAKNGCLGLNWGTIHCVCLSQGSGDFWTIVTVTTDLSCFQFAPEDWPQNEQCRLHFPEFLRGYRSSAEAVDTRFPFSDATRRVDDNSVCFNDGFAKVLIMTSICCFIHELESWLDFWFDLFPTWISLLDGLGSSLEKKVSINLLLLRNGPMSSLSILK